MHWLVQGYVERFKFWGMVMAAIFPAGLIALPVGGYLAKLLDWDDQIPIAACFFAVLALEAWAYDRVRWWFFRVRK
jgi:hypothetical protein